MSRPVLATVYFLVASLVGLTTFSGCTKSDPTPGLPGAGQTPSTTAQAADDKATREVNLAIWANYLSPETIARFTQKTGIRLNVSNYSSNEELLAKIQAGAAGIDVAVPSESMVSVLKKLDLLLPLDPSLIPNKAGLDPKYTGQSFDPKNEFSLPYAWTSVGLAINRDLYKGELKSYKELLTKTDVAGKFSLLDDNREALGAALKALGYSINTSNTDELSKAQAMLKAAKPRVKMFTSDTIDPLVNKEIAIAQTFSSDALQAAKRSKSKIEFIIPEEGSTRAIDNLVILKSAKNTKEGQELINFLIAEDSNLEFVEKNMGGPVVLATKKALPKDLATSQTLYPSDAVLKKLEPVYDVGEATRQYDRIWTEIKTE
jgi:spermidine/putrescine transport system substrate-binding protein